MCTMEKEVIKVACPTSYIVSNKIDTKKKRVAAYARVSTDMEDQLHSFKTQIDEYTKKITSNPDWIFVGMYSDEGISGTSLKHRDGLNSLLNEAKKGNIDLILTKSISRLGRNTLDILTIIRELREKNVEIRFEKENISSLDTRTDMILTFHSSIAQEEAKNISDNVKWSIRKKMREGNWTIATSKFLGFTTDADGNMIIDEEQAKVVIEIYNLFLANKSYQEIIDYLTAMGYKTGSGSTKWTRQTIQSILKNEKYAGDLLLQKTVVVDYLTHEAKDNRDGKYADLWLIKNHHPAIIKREVYDLVQTIMQKKAENFRHKPKFDITPLSTKVYCGTCGRSMIFQTRPNGRDVFACNISRREIQKNVCTQTPIKYKDLCDVCYSAMKDYLQDKNLTSSLLDMIRGLGTAAAKQTKLAKLKDEVQRLEVQLRDIIELKISSKTDDEDEKLSEQYKSIKKRVNQLRTELANTETAAYRSFINEARAKEIEEAIKSVDNRDCYLKLIDEVIVFENEVVIVDNFGTDISKEDFSQIAPQLIKMEPVLYGFFTSSYSRKVIKYRLIRLGGSKWK